MNADFNQDSLSVSRRRGVHELRTQSEKASQYKGRDIKLKDKNTLESVKVPENELKEKDELVKGHKVTPKPPLSASHSSPEVLNLKFTKLDEFYQKLVKISPIVQSNVVNVELSEAYENAFKAYDDAILSKTKTDFNDKFNAVQKAMTILELELEIQK